MSPPGQLTLEQQLQLSLKRRELEETTLGQVHQELVETVRALMLKDNSIKELFRQKT